MHLSYKNDAVGLYNTIRRLIETNSDIDDKIINEVYQQFGKIINLDPNLTDEQTLISIFQSLDELTNHKEYNMNLSVIVPFSIYPTLINFFYQTHNSFIHKTISKIIVCLTGNISTSLYEFMKYNLLQKIYQYLNSFEFPNSIEFLVQIVGNFLDDDDTVLSDYAKTIFNFSFFINLLKFLKNSTLPSQLCNSILHRWLACMCKFFQESHSQEQSLTFLIEVAPVQMNILENSKSCIFFVYIISQMVQANTINYDEFNRLTYPTTIQTISFFDDPNDPDIPTVKRNAILLIAELISKDRFVIPYFVNDSIDMALNDSKIAESALHLCCCCFTSENKKHEAYEAIQNNTSILLNFSQQSNFPIQKQICILFCEYIEYILTTHSFISDQDFNNIFMLFYDIVESYDLEIMNTILVSLGAFINFCINASCPKNNEIISITQNILLKLIENFSIYEDENIFKASSMLMEEIQKRQGAP